MFDTLPRLFPATADAGHGGADCTFIAEIRLGLIAVAMGLMIVLAAERRHLATTPVAPWTARIAKSGLAAPSR